MAVDKIWQFVHFPIFCFINCHLKCTQSFSNAVDDKQQFQECYYRIIRKIWNDSWVNAIGKSLYLCVCVRFFRLSLPATSLFIERVKWVTETRRLNYVHADIHTKFHRYAFIWMSVIVRMYELIQSMAIVKIERKYLPMIFILSNYLAIRMPFSVFVCEFCKILCTF